MTANLELYRANIAAASAFPSLAADLHRLRTGSPAVVAFVCAQQRAGVFPLVVPERLANWLGVLSIGGVRQLLGLDPSAVWQAANKRAICRLFARGWLPETGDVPEPDSVRAEPPVTAPLRPDVPGRIGQARWAALLRHALVCFAADGVRGTSVDAIGASVGMGKTTIYRRYANKDGLLAAAIDQAVDDLLAERMAFEDSESDIAATLFTFARTIDRQAARPASIALTRLLVTLPPEWRETARNAWLRLTGPARAALAARLAAWRAEGRLQLSDPLLAAEHFLVLAGRGNTRFTSNPDWRGAEEADHARDVVALCLRR